MFVAIYVANEIHMEYMIFPPSRITHRNVIHCGVTDRNGEMNNPYHEDGVQ